MLKMWPTAVVVALGGLALAVAGCSAVGATGGTHPTAVPMVTPTSGELGYEQGYPPQGQCQIHTVTRYRECSAPLNGLRVRLGPGNPEAGMFLTLPATTMETRDRAVIVKEAVWIPAINNQIKQSVFGQLLVHHRPVVGARMRTVWHYHGGTRRCGGRSGRYAVATCSEMPLGFGTTDGEPVTITVSFVYGDHLYSSNVSYVASSD